ncbi:MAG TPA: hypothetical protein VN224_01015 [Xanthomonadales bacterium]|nr:hypothetical protein [Xanthomonadales bacterium]
MNRRFTRCALAASLVLTPLAASAQTPATHPDGALPFGQWTIVNGQVDESAIVWSRCRSANGQTGRWIATHPAEVVHPTYVIQQGSVPRTPDSAAVKLGALVECVGEDGGPGAPDPAVPATAVLPRGTTLVYGSSVRVHQTDIAPPRAHGFSFALHDGETASDDGSGPVIVTANRIAVFSRAATLLVGGSNTGSLSIYRPGAPVPPAPTSCRVIAYDRNSTPHEVGAEAGTCTALPNEERQRVVRDARAQLAIAPR